MLKPRALRPGDRLSVIAPASPFERDLFELGLAELRDLSFEPVYEPSVFYKREYVAGDPATRAEAFMRAWSDDSVAGVVAARGGYGSVQLLPYLDAESICCRPKVFVGYSDLTAMLNYLTGRCGMVAFHGPTVVGSLASGVKGYDRQSFLQLLMHPEPLGELSLDGLECVRSGEASGVLLGGTLTQLVASLGTPFAFAPPKGFVLFLDEVGERPYRLDRMLTQLMQSGIVDFASAIIVGEFPECDEPGGHPTAYGTMVDVLRDFRGPIILGLPSGHTRGPGITLPFGVKVHVISGTHSKISINEAAVV